jgi:hypothetical protein
MRGMSRLSSRFVGTGLTPMILLVAAAAAGCSKPSEGDAAKPASSSPVASAATKAAPPPPMRDAAGKLTKAGVGAAWREVFVGADAEVQPMEKKLAAFEAKVGKPAKVEQDQRIWFAMDGADCYRVELGKDGIMRSQKLSASQCGA